MLTGIWHQLDSVTHHTHLVQTRLPIKEHVAVQTVQHLFRLQKSTRDSLSVLQMPLHDPPILQERVGSLVVSKINTFTGILHNIACSWVRGWPIADKFLEVGNIVRRH